MDKALTGNDLQPIFLTLTVKNVPGEELGETLKKMSEGWNRLFTGRGYKSNFLGWFRAVEVTYNKKDGTYHPHYHVLILAAKEYFTGRGYKTTEQWSKAWKRAARLDHDPICYVQKVKNKVGADYETTGRKAYAEVAKYTVKSSDYIQADPEATDTTVRILAQALAGKRLFAYGGVLKLLAKQYEEEQKEERKLREDIQEVIVQYRWNIGAGRYERKEETWRT
jgi:plasmid rolling circle replication initiator protein Rep